MKNFIAISIFCFVFLTTATAQMDLNIVPKTSMLSANLFGKVNEIVLPPFSKEQTDQFDYNDAKNGRTPVMARNISTSINLKSTGTWTNLPTGGRIWRVQITAANALALAPLFNELYLPPGASMHIYMPGKEEVLGAFTNDNTPEPRYFCAGLVHGETCIIEYYEPETEKGKGIISIDKVGYAYRWVKPLAKSIESGSGSCEVNVICPEGDNWRDQIRSVVRIFVVVNDSSEGWCSGSLVNNVRKDCTPYILSAEHCTENTGTSPLYAQWVFYFNYQSDSCTGVSGPQTDIVNGCKELANSNDDGGASGSDFLLLELNHTPPTSFNVYYSGWDVTNTAPSSGVGVHHPNADIKKISTYTTAATSTAWGTIAQNTHWQVVWAATADGHGVTEPGSSGSPLYNSSNSLIVGHLTGGSSCCTLDGCSGNGIGPTSPDLYGKVAYDWTSNGISSNLQLKPWLDPDNTGTTTLQGMNPPCGTSLQNDAGVQAIPEPNGTICSSTVTPIIVLRNFGGNTLTSATITYKFDNGSPITLNWTGNLLAGETLDVTLQSATMSAGAHTFNVVVSSPNGVTNTNTGNDNVTSNFFVSSPGGSLNLMLTTDNVGTKTTWQITDAASNVVASGGPYPDLQGGTTYNIPICIPAGCYTFTIFSSAGDGMTTGENGNFVITGTANSTQYAAMTTPAFGNQEAHNFCVTAFSGINQIETINASIIPNPSTGQFNVIVGNNEEKLVRVFDMTGRLILERKTSDQSFIIDITNESRGVYILEIGTLAGKAVEKLVLK
jgi:lysyl endopeptidase